MIKRLNLAMVVFLASFGLALPCALLAAQNQAPALSYVPGEVIVKYKENVDAYKKNIDRFRVFGQLKKAFKRNLDVVTLGKNISVAEAIDIYKQDPDVLYAEPNYLLHLTGKSGKSGQPNLTATPNDPSYGSLWGLTKINAPGAWNITTGSNNAVVVVIDTGIDYTHPDLAANMYQNTDCNNDGIHNDPCFGIDVANGDNDPRDDHYHGTHVAGTIGAVGNNGIGVVGVNWKVKLHACKFFDASGNATTDGAIECLDYVKALKARGINVVATNNSWGGDENSQALYDAIDEQRQAGILFISGAGNGNLFGIGQDNDTTPFYPCNFFLANMICVAATTSTDSRAGFSNYGLHTVHVGAPGESILSTLPQNQGSYGSLDGTSMATPHVAGLAALLYAQNPSRNWSQIKNLILAGGNTIGSMSSTITGKRINANDAMTCSNSAIQRRLQPVASSISASPGVPVLLASLNINCANPNGNVSVSVSSGGSITLLDGGVNGDQAAGDGIYSATWTPTAVGNYTLTFPGNDTIAVSVANPGITVTPSLLGFGGVGIGQSLDRDITVSNTGGGVVAGSATTNAPFSIVSGGTYSLSSGQSQTVTIRFTPTSLGTFNGQATFTGGDGASVTLTGSAAELNSITPSPLDLTLPPPNFTVTGNGFANFGFGLPIANFYRNGTLIAQVRASSGNSTSLTFPFPTNQGLWQTLPGLSVGDATLQVYNQLSAEPDDPIFGAPAEFALIGALPVTIIQSTIATSFTSITPTEVDLTSPPANFIAGGTGFTNFGFGLPIANFYRNGTLIGQVRASSGNSTSLTLPFPTTQGVYGPVPGLSVGDATVDVYNQTGAGTFALVGTLPITITQSAPSTSLTSINPSQVDLTSPPANFLVGGTGFTNFGFGLPIANFYLNGTLVGQVRASSGNITSLTLPFPTTQGVYGPVPGLSVGDATVNIYNQTGASSFALVGGLPITITQSAPSTSVTSITPSQVYLSAPPANFVVGGTGFTTFGFGLPIANFYLNGTLVGQVRASSGGSTSLTLPFPTTQGVYGPVPGLSAGNTTVQIYHQTGASTFSLAGSIAITVNNTP